MLYNYFKYKCIPLECLGCSSRAFFAVSSGVDSMERLLEVSAEWTPFVPLTVFVPFTLGASLTEESGSFYKLKR